MQNVKYSFQDLVVEFVRRGVLSVNEGKELFAYGRPTERYINLVESRVRDNPHMKIRGAFMVEDEQKCHAENIRIRFLIDHTLSN